MKTKTKGISCKATVALVLAFHLITMGWLPAAQAAMIGTDRFIESSDASTLKSNLHSTLQSEEVRHQLAAMGVSPEQAAARVAALTEEELRSVAQRIQELPAGGSFFGVVGVVFVVLLLLEIVGVTDIFKKL